MKLKIAVTADIHFGSDAGDSSLQNLVKTLVKNEIKYLVIAGDLTSRGSDHPSFSRALDILGDYPGTILFTPGNHDLWTKDGDSYRIYRETLPEAFKNKGHHMLDGNPFIIEGTGIVGSIGWYDYSFRHVPPYLGVFLRDAVFEFPDGNSGVRHVKWDDLTEDDYVEKRSKVTTDRQKWKVSTWQDKKFIQWNLTDKRFLNECIERLREDIESIYPHVDEIIAITHHLPFTELVPDIPDPTWSFHRAYLGSEKIGELFREYPKVKYAFSGHVHRKNDIDLGGLRAITTYFHSTPGLYVVIIEE